MGISRAYWDIYNKIIELDISKNWEGESIPY